MSPTESRNPPLETNVSGPFSLLQRIRPSALTAIGIFGSAMVALVFSISLWYERGQILERVQQQASSLALVMNRDIENSFDSYELSLQQIVDTWNNDAVAALPEALRRQIIFDRASSARSVVSVLVINAAGEAIMDLRQRDSKGANFSDRDYFVAHKESSSIRAYLSRPFVSRITGDTNIALSKRLSFNDGRFAGVAVVVISLDYFKKLLDGVDVGSGGRASIVRSDGIMLMSYPFRENLIGFDASNTQVFRKSQESKAAGFLAYSSVDDEDRFYGVDRGLVSNTNVYIGYSLNDVFAAWWRHVALSGIAVFLFTMLLVPLLSALGHELTARKKAERAMEQMAKTDVLTGLANRRAIDVALSLEVRRWKRTGHPLSVVFIDVDYFKKFNDFLGHLEGDRVLAQVGGVMRGIVARPGDVAGRFGGEEFLAILGDTGVEGAHHVAEKIRQAVEALNIPHPNSPWGRVTVSLGVSQIQGPDATETELLKTADSALYDAKAQGRNRVVASGMGIAGAPQGRVAGLALGKAQAHAGQHGAQAGGDRATAFEGFDPAGEVGTFFDAAARHLLGGQ